VKPVLYAFWMIVNWDDKYNTGIGLIDEQHKALVIIINDLYLACTDGYEDTGVAFKEALKRMVDYVHFHFGAEQKLLEKIKYPMFTEHKKQHDTMVNDILEAAKEYNEGKRFVPNHFVRTLRDWVFSHIALSDTLYAAYIAEKKKDGLLNDHQIALYLQG
jgi:hemerythrin